jgi:MoaA/NifB/PqqE/SkfB family radical SAM enzyme
MEPGHTPPVPRRSLSALKEENSRLLREDIGGRRLVYRGLPEIVTLNSTDVCNLACVMCQRSLAQGLHRLEDRVLRFVAEQLFPTARKVVLTTAGGEPLGAGFDVIVEQARRFETKIDVTTNGQLLRRQLAEEFLPLLDHLNVSVDAVRPEIYERIRVGGSFEKLERNLRDFRQAILAGGHDVLFSISAVVMASTLPYLDELVRFAAEIGAQGVLLQRLQHTVKATPEEEPSHSFTPGEIEAHLQAAEAAARLSGVNLLQGELGRAPVWGRPFRPKHPEPLEPRGMCTFLAQTFTVMYTGEVYPCCRPTDHLLGDVRFDDPVAIWNGAALQDLRAAHLDGTGTLFCRGCDLAPHLPAKGPTRLVGAAQLGRRALAHVLHRRQRERREREELPLFEGRLPQVSHRAPVVEVPARGAILHPLGLRIEALSFDPLEQEMAFVAGGELFLGGAGLDRPRRLAVLPAARDRFAALLHFTADGDALLAFEEGGGLLRFDRRTGAVRCVDPLSDPRAFARGGAVAETGGELYVGEYGIFPGARCANVLRSVDGGRSFEAVARFRDAHHIHALVALADGRLLATCGDFPRERKTWVGTDRGQHWVCALDAWAGFTAACVDGRTLFLGTDLLTGNGIVRWNTEFSGLPEFTPLPPAHDLQLRQIERLEDGRLVALGALDENLVAERASARPALFVSEDRGDQWSVVHRFAEDWSDAPEAMARVPGSPGRLLTARGAEAQVIELGPRS